MAFLGALSSPILSTLYSYGYNAIVPNIPILGTNDIANAIARIGIPFALAGIVKTFKLPFGALINGSLLGIGVVQIIHLIAGFLTGQATPTGELSAGDLTLATDIGDFFGTFGKE